MLITTTKGGNTKNTSMETLFICTCTYIYICVCSDKAFAECVTMRVRAAIQKHIRSGGKPQMVMRMVA